MPLRLIGVMAIELPQGSEANEIRQMRILCLHNDTCRFREGQRKPVICGG